MNSSCSASAPANSGPFRPFPRLPTELRPKIWQHVCSQPRDVFIWGKFWDYGELRQGDTNTAVPGITDFLFRFITNLRPPAILHASQEAREEALRHYTLDFGFSFYRAPEYRFSGITDYRLCIRNGMICTESSIYFNWGVDRLCVPPDVVYRRKLDTEYQATSNFYLYLVYFKLSQMLPYRGLTSLAMGRCFDVPDGSEREYGRSRVHYKRGAKSTLRLCHRIPTLQEVAVYAFHDDMRLTVFSGAHQSRLQYDMGLVKSPETGSYFISEEGRRIILLSGCREDFSPFSLRRRKRHQLCWRNCPLTT